MDHQVVQDVHVETAAMEGRQALGLHPARGHAPQPVQRWVTLGVATQHSGEAASSAAASRLCASGFSTRVGTPAASRVGPPRGGSRSAWPRPQSPHTRLRHGEAERGICDDQRHVWTRAQDTRMVLPHPPVAHQETPEAGRHQPSRPSSVPTALQTPRVLDSMKVTSSWTSATSR